jgi:hypothetical protein
VGAGVSLVWDCGVANAVRLPEVLSWAKLRLALLDLPFVAHSSSCSSHVSRLGFFHSVNASGPWYSFCLTYHSGCSMEHEMVSVTPNFSVGTNHRGRIEHSS